MVMHGAASSMEAALAMSDIWRSATILAIKEIEARRRREMVASIIEALRRK
jgi:hypothetical protein